VPNTPFLEPPTGHERQRHVVARRGQTIESPRTGERLTFLQTAADTGGELMSFEFALAPGGGVPVAHVHRFQEERYHVLEGTFAFRIRRTGIELGPGRSLAVRAGVPHRLWNPGDREARMVIEFRPALRMEDLFVDLWALARSRRTNRWGIPRDPLLAALLGHAYLREGVLPVVPAWLQRASVAPLAALARALGYRLPTERGA
jgi:mannose-6-phosphate isomerase-like protein (cupin superfamily)